MNKGQELSKATVNTFGRLEPDYEADYKGLAKEYSELAGRVNGFAKANDVLSNWLAEAKAEIIKKDKQLEANWATLKVVRAEVAHQHDTIEDYKQNLLEMKQQIERLLS